MKRLVFVLVLALAGCGGDDRLSKREYEEKVRSEYAQVQDAFRATGVAFRKPDLAEKIEQAQAELREMADALDETEPPAEVAAENQQIVDAMRRYADSLDRLRNAAERGDLKVIEDATARIAENEAVEQIAEAAERMKFKGYDLGDIAEE
jgi:predicted ribosome quality control (RQC) complex YloA/Tae2 family protein